MSIVYEYLKPPKTPEEAVNPTKDKLVPLMKKYWSSKGKQVYGEEFDLSVLPFIQMWLHGNLIMIVAKDGDKEVGFFIGIVFEPMTFKANVVQAELWDADTKEIEEGLFRYLFNIVQVKNLNEIWIMSDVPNAPELPWVKKNVFTVTRYVEGG